MALQVHSREGYKESLTALNYFKPDSFNNLNSLKELHQINSK